MRGVKSLVAVGSIAAMAVSGATAASATTRPAHLTGSGQGMWQVQVGNPDAGTTHAVRGRGHFSIGVAKIRGTAQSPGNIAVGYCNVTLRLITSTGSVTITGHPKATSTYQSCIGGVRFRFHTTQATGSLAGATYQGIGHLDLENASASTTDQGSFTLRLNVLPTG